MNLTRSGATLAALWALALITVVGCGGRTLSGTGDASANTNNIGGDAGGLCVDDMCVIGIRTDNCCEAAFATTLGAIAADPCLDPWPSLWEQIPQSCSDAWDPECAYIDCMPGPPRWRIAECTAADGVCEMVPECSSASDCVLGIDHRKCCPCPEGVPPELVEADPCITLHEGGSTTVPVACYPTMCPEMPCAQCPLNPPQCTDDGACWNDNPGW